MPSMDSETFRNVLRHEIEDAQSWLGGGIRGEQRQALQYYLGLPLGNEIDGRSQVVSWDVFETVEGALPNFLEPFFSGDNIGEFLPRGPEDAAFAEQATELVNYVIKEENNGYLLFADWFKDALLSKVGVLRVKWVQPDPVREQFQGLTVDQLALLMQDPAVEIVGQAPSEMVGDEIAQAAQMPIPVTWDVDILRKQRGKIEIRGVEPRAFIINKDAKRDSDIRLIGEFVSYTRSDLKEMGFADDVQSYDGLDWAVDPEETIWKRAESNSDDRALEEVRLFEGFARVDYNGDGVAEWRRVLLAGDQELENEEVDDHDYAFLTPIKLPHRVIGMSLADTAVELQRLSTGLTRQYVDSLYLANNPRTYVNMAAQINLDDVISNRIGGIIRGNGPAGDAVHPIRTAMVATESLQGLEMVQGMRERRTGVTRYNQGLDADSLNKTATGITKIADMADKRMMLILRNFAETGVKRLFKLVLRMLVQYQDVVMTVRLRNQFVRFDPRMWSADMDVSTDVGLGTGDRTATLQALQLFGRFMQQAAGAGLIGPAQVFEFGKAIAKAAKLKGADEKYMKSPEQIQQQPPKPPPEMIKALLEQEKMQSQQRLQQMKLQAEAMEGDKRRAAEVQVKQMELAEQRWAKLVELAAGYIMGQSRMAGLMPAPQNIIAGTMLDQNAQAPGITPAAVDEAAAIINNLAAQLQGGA